MTLETVQEVPVSQIIPGDNDRERFDKNSIAELAESIRKHGLAQPITVRPFGAGFQIVAGERRWRAHKLLKAETIPALVRDMDDERASGVMLLENIQRAELNPIEEAQAYQKRIDRFGWDVSRLAIEASVPIQRIRLRLALLETVPEAQKLVRDGQMGIKYAYALKDLDSNRQRIALRYIATTAKPRIKEFRQLCSKLLEEQAQEAMFDMAAFMTTVVDTRKAEEEARPERIIPTNDDLPGMRKANNVALALERYIRDLVDAGLQDEARVVGSVYRGLLQHHIIHFPKGPSPLIYGETK